MSIEALQGPQGNWAEIIVQDLGSLSGGEIILPQIKLSISGQ
jgi:hypothetical protein